MKINKNEIIRYLGYKESIPDSVIDAIIDSCIDELSKKVTPKYTYGIFNLEFDGNDSLTIGNLHIHSTNLRKNLVECKNAILFCATIGIQADFIIKKWSKIDMSRDVILQAVSASMIEEYCDECQTTIEDEMHGQDLFLRPRFSPGYGDFCITHQKQIIAMLDCPRKIGVTLTDSCMMIPSKSVTAVIGISTAKHNCPIKGCEECAKIDCQFRRS